MNTQKLSLISVLAAVCLGIQLLPRPMNLEFTSVIAFVTGMVFGSLLGALLGAIVMFVNGFLSPFGFAGVNLPFQIAGIVLIGAVGGLYAKMTNGKWSVAGAYETVVLGAFLTFIYDVITNAGYAFQLTLLYEMPFSAALVAVLVSGAIPSVMHVAWNAAVFGAVTVPLVNSMQKLLGWRK